MARSFAVLSVTAVIGLVQTPAVQANPFDAALNACIQTVESCQPNSKDKKECEDQAKKVPKCNKNLVPGTLCQLKLDDMHPTQNSVGEYATQCKAEKVKKWEDDDKLKSKLLEAKRHIPVVIGPKEKKHPAYYITDHHHLTYAMTVALDKKYIERDELYACILDNRGTQDPKDFWRFMVQNHFVWLDDQNAQALTVHDLPDSLKNLNDNPYRTWSRWVRDNCGYLKSGKDCVPPSFQSDSAYFMEFRWADYLEQNLDRWLESARKGQESFSTHDLKALDPDADVSEKIDTKDIAGLSEKKITTATSVAILLAQGDQALVEHLPGYSDGCVVEPRQPKFQKIGDLVCEADDLGSKVEKKGCQDN